MKRSEIFTRQANYIIDAFKKAGVNEKFLNAFENKVIAEVAQTIASEENP